MTSLWVCVGIAFVAVLLLLLLPKLGEWLHLSCGAVGWVTNRPYLCRCTKWHYGPHASAWHTTPESYPEQVRVKWFDGEFGAASSTETRDHPTTHHDVGAYT